MKIIFLDIDGVLNVIPHEYDQYGSLFHKQFENNLRNIIEKTDAKIVISSTWRKSGLHVMKSMWMHRGLAGEIIDCTPQIYYNHNKVVRGHEIQEWLNKNPQVTSYVILDDDKDMLTYQLENFVLCAENLNHDDCVDLGYGLTKKCAEKAILILNKYDDSI